MLKVADATSSNLSIVSVTTTIEFLSLPPSPLPPRVSSLSRFALRVHKHKVLPFVSAGIMGGLIYAQLRDKMRSLRREAVSVQLEYHNACARFSVFLTVSCLLLRLLLLLYCYCFLLLRYCQSSRWSLSQGMFYVPFAQMSPCCVKCR